MTIVVIDVKVTTTGTGAKLILAKSGDDFTQALIFSDEISTIADLSAWLLAQTARQSTTDQVLQKRLTIDYHIDQVVDPETGQLVDQTVIDSTGTQPLPEDDGRANFAAMPGWATWTDAEAEAWIEANVTDLASAKTALKAMAKAIVYLRNVTID